VPRPTTPYWNSGVAPALYPGLNTRETATFNWIQEVAGVPALDAKNDLGAVGNGTTNDTAALQTGIDALEAAGGGLVFFDVGVMCAANGLTVEANNIGFVGMGRSSGLRQVAGVADNTALVIVRGTTATPETGNRFGFAMTGMDLYGQIETDPATQFVHLVVLDGASDVDIRRCRLRGWRGDAIYMASGFPTHTERHNERINIERNVLDGINKLNRNCITITDGTDVQIHGNWVGNCTSTSMPGAIDIEPNNQTYTRLRNVAIERNAFVNVGGNVGVIALDMFSSQESLTIPLKKLRVAHNMIRGCTNNAGMFLRSRNNVVAATTEPHVLDLEGNHVEGGVTYPLYVEGIRLLRARAEVYEDTGRSMTIGWAYRCRDIQWQGTLRRVGIDAGQERAISIASLDHGEFDATFEDIGDPVATWGRLIHFTYNSGNPSTSSHITVKGSAVNADAHAVTLLDASYVTDAKTNSVAQLRTPLQKEIAYWARDRQPPNWSNAQLGAVATASRAFAAVNSQIFVAIPILAPTTITGIRYRKGSGTTAANVRVAMYDVAGARIANRGTDFAQGTTANVTRSVAFDAPVQINEPGIYWASIIGGATAADFMGWAATNEYLGQAFAATQGGIATAGSITPPAETTEPATVVPLLVTY
jgi:hypothetical protein